MKSKTIIRESETKSPDYRKSKTEAAISDDEEHMVT